MPRSASSVTAAAAQPRRPDREVAREAQAAGLGDAHVGQVDRQVLAAADEHGVVARERPFATQDEVAVGRDREPALQRRGRRRGS